MSTAIVLRLDPVIRLLTQKDLPMSTLRTAIEFLHKEEKALTLTAPRTSEEKLVKQGKILGLRKALELLELAGKQAPPLMGLMGFYLLWHRNKGAWWRPQAAGYTESAEEAGLYTKKEADFYELIDTKAVPLVPNKPPTWQEIMEILERFREPEEQATAILGRLGLV